MESRPISISLFNKNNPQSIEEGPNQVLDFDSIDKVIIKGLNLGYLPLGNDIIINNLSQISIEQNRKEIVITGKQSE